MAVIRFFNKKNSRNEKGQYTLKRALEYITNPEKTHFWSDGLYVDAENALERMSIVKRFYNNLCDVEHLKISTIDNIHNVLHQVFQQKNQKSSNDHIFH